MKQKTFYVQITSTNESLWYYRQRHAIYLVYNDEEYPKLYFLINPPTKAYRCNIRGDLEG